MSEINPYWIKIFHAVAERKTFTKASEKLDIKKATVSNIINQLEDALNVKLFYRNNKGVTLTEDGMKYFEFIDKGLGYFDAGEKLIRTNNNIETGEITIGALSHISHFYLIEEIKKLRQDYPNVKVKIKTGATGKELIKLLENHKVDFVLDSTTMNLKNNDIQKERLKTIENILVSNKPIKMEKLKELESKNIIIGARNTKTSQELIDLMKQNDITIKSNLEIDITELKIDAAKLELGIAYVMKDSVINELNRKELYEVKLPIKLPTSSINLLYLKGQLTNVDKNFIKNYLKK